MIKTWRDFRPSERDRLGIDEKRKEELLKRNALNKDLKNEDVR